MKKIVFWAGNITKLAGTERATFTIASGLAKTNKYHIYIISTKGTKADIAYPLDSRVKVLCLNVTNLKTSYLSLFYKLNKVLMKEKIDYLVSVETMSLLFTLPVVLWNRLRKKTLKYIVWEHFNFSINLDRKLRCYSRKLAAKYADGIVVLTERDLELWLSNLNTYAVVKVINNASPFIVSEVNYNINSNKIIAIGRLAHQKGFDRLLDIWKLYLKEYPLANEKWILQIVGSGPERLMLNSKVKENNLEDSVEMIENTNDITQIYENASFIAMTSRFEGLPMTLIEAQSYGLPIIAYDCLTGPSEIITEDSGFLISDNNVIEFIKKLNELINNPDLRIRMSQAAKSEVARYNIDTIISDWDLLFKTL